MNTKPEAITGQCMQYVNFVYNTHSYAYVYNKYLSTTNRNSSVPQPIGLQRISMHVWTVLYGNRLCSANKNNKQTQWPHIAENVIKTRAYKMMKVSY